MNRILAAVKTISVTLTAQLTAAFKFDVRCHDDLPHTDCAAQTAAFAVQCSMFPENSLFSSNEGGRKVGLWLMWKGDGRQKAHVHLSNLPQDIVRTSKVA